jgi:hypothetical protein
MAFDSLKELGIKTKVKDDTLDLFQSTIHIRIQQRSNMLQLFQEFQKT